MRMRLMRLTIACLLGAATTALADDRESRPNIVLFLVDDMGWQDTSVEFHRERTVWNDLYRTPNMERLAERGMRFTNAYSASPVCSPSRVSVVTGKNPARTRVTDWVVGDGSLRAGNSSVRPPSWRRQGLQPGDGLVAFPTVLREAGYRTIHAGKAHWGARGYEGGHDPTSLGFDVNIGGSERGGPYPSYFSPWIPRPEHYPNLQEHPEGAYITDVLTIEAIAAVDRAIGQNKPFFLHLSHYAVHTPIPGQGDPRFLDRYDDGRPEVEQHYAAMIESMDRSLGRVLDALEQRGVAEETLVIFLSDNGGLSNHTRADDPDPQSPWKRDWHNSPLRSGKGAAYEGGIRVPMIVGWAGTKPEGERPQASPAIEPGSVCHEPVHTDDLFPTVLSVAGVANPVSAVERDGQNLSPLLRGDPWERGGALYWHYPHQWYRDFGCGLGIEPFTAVRRGDWKLIYFYGDGVPDGEDPDPRWELYNLADDIGESTNLVQPRADVARRLARTLLAWMKDVEAQPPISLATDEPVPLPDMALLTEPAPAR